MRSEIPLRTFISAVAREQQAQTVAQQPPAMWWDEYLSKGTLFLPHVGADGYAVTNCWEKDSVGWCYLNTIN